MRSKISFLFLFVLFAVFAHSDFALAQSQSRATNKLLKKNEVSVEEFERNTGDYIGFYRNGLLMKVYKKEILPQIVPTKLLTIRFPLDIRESGTFAKAVFRVMDVKGVMDQAVGEGWDIGLKFLQVRCKNGNGFVFSREEFQDANAYLAYAPGNFSERKYVDNFELVRRDKKIDLAPFQWVWQADVADDANPDKYDQSKVSETVKQLLRNPKEWPSQVVGINVIDYSPKDPTAPRTPAQAPVENGIQQPFDTAP